MPRPCDIEVSCGPCGKKQARFKNVGAAWHTLEIEIDDEKRLIIDGVDMKPAPYQEKPGRITYFKNGKKQTVEKLKGVSIAVTTLCTDPDCDDPMCKIFQELQQRKQELQRLKNRPGFWRRLSDWLSKPAITIQMKKKADRKKKA